MLILYYNLSYGVMLAKGFNSDLFWYSANVELAENEMKNINDSLEVNHYVSR